MYISEGGNLDFFPSTKYMDNMGFRVK
jgi:hypothetical protein